MTDLQIPIALEGIEQIQISRSFSRKKQIAQYEPVDIFASVQATLKPGATAEYIQDVSERLNQFAVKTVEKDLDQYVKSHTSPF